MTIDLCRSPLPALLPSHSECQQHLPQQQSGCFTLFFQLPKLYFDTLCRLHLLHAVRPCV